MFLLLFALLYEKWWLPKKCRDQGEDVSLNVKTWNWVSGNCVANTCSTGYTFVSGKCVKIIPTKERKYIKTYGKCNTKEPFKVDRVVDVQACQNWCDDMNGCYGFDYAGDQQCNLYDIPPTQVEPAAGTDCYTLNS
jgi:hypothetical protein